MVLNSSIVDSLIVHGPRLRAPLEGEVMERCARWLFLDVESDASNTTSFALVLRGQDACMYASGKEDRKRVPSFQWNDDGGAYRTFIIGTSDNSDDLTSAAAQLLEFFDNNEERMYSNRFAALGATAREILPVLMAIHGGDKHFAGGVCSFAKRAEFVAARADKSKKVKGAKSSTEKLLVAPESEQIAALEALTAKLGPDVLARILAGNVPSAIPSV